MQLRKACNHPFLFDLGDNLDDEIYSKYLVEWSGKMKLLDRLLPRLLNDNHKVLIFSQFTTMLDLISNYLALKQIACCRIDGAVSLTDRQDQIRDFTEDPALKVFLLSTKAGGLGINLVAADTVIIFDSDWNPQNDLQAQDRCHRIGQTKQVLVYRLISQNSVEKRMLESANEKRSLERTVIHKSQFKGSKKYYQSKSSIVDLKAIFEEEATAINLQQGESHADSVLTDEQLDRILDRTSDFVKDPSIALVGAVEDVHSSIVTR